LELKKLDLGLDYSCYIKYSYLVIKTPKNAIKTGQTGKKKDAKLSVEHEVSILNSRNRLRRCHGR